MTDMMLTDKGTALKQTDEGIYCYQNHEKENPLISVIVPVYNVEPYIEQCLKSIVNQTLKNIEIIIVNDASPANEDPIIQKFCAGDKRIKYIKNPHNMGLAESRNIGFKHATGEYFGCVDSDDYIAPDMFEKLYLKAKKFDADMCFCNLTEIDCAADDRQQPYYITDENVLKLEHNCFSFCDIDNFPFSYWTGAYLRIYKKDFFISNITYPTGRKHEDVLPHFTGFFRAKKITFVNEPLYFYRKNRSGSITNLELAVDDVIAFLRDVLTLFQQENLYNRFKLQLSAFLVQVFYWYYPNKKLFNFIKEKIKPLSDTDIKRLPSMKKRALKIKRFPFWLLKLLICLKKHKLQQ